MVRRPSLSVLFQTYHWVRAHDGQTSSFPLPHEVQRELLALAALLPLAEQLLDAPWHLTTYMMDAAELGGGICSCHGSLDEIRSKGAFAAKGGWAICTGFVQSTDEEEDEERSPRRLCSRFSGRWC